MKHKANTRNCQCQYGKLPTVIFNMPSTLYKVYVLSDFDGNVFYVGITSKSLGVRAGQHISQAKLGSGNQIKNKIIRLLNYKFDIKVVDQIRSAKSSVARNLETAWIHTYSSMGFKLCNLCQTCY